MTYASETISEIQISWSETDRGNSGSLCDLTCPAHTLAGIIRELDREGLAWQNMLDTLQQIRAWSLNISENRERGGRRGEEMGITAELDAGLIGEWLTDGWQNMKGWPWILQSEGTDWQAASHSPPLLVRLSPPNTTCKPKYTQKHGHECAASLLFSHSL